MNTPLKAFKMLMIHVQHVFQNKFRIDAAGNKRIEAAGDNRITADSDY